MTARQLVHRPRRLLSPRILATGSRPRDPDFWYPLAAGLAVDRAPQSGPTRRPESTGAFEAVGSHRLYRDDSSFWHPGDDGLLFAFHLHGFADLARYAGTEGCPEHDSFWAQVISSWLDRAGEPCTPGWHPYPMSWRIATWCSALSRGGWPSILRQRMLRSLVQQVVVLSRSIEHDIGGNHVVRNASALIIAGVCLGDERVERNGINLLYDELSRQILVDGGHEERSTSYHRAVRADLLDVEALLARAARPLPDWLARSTEAMTTWERAMRGPDGNLPLLNDAWEGPAEPDVQPRDPTTVLRSSGYVVLSHGADQTIIDVGLVAPPHLPPHAHADALSFVLWADGRPVITDPGSFAYSGPERRRYRATAAHNTLEIDRLDQCELWGDFRAAFMPRVELRDVVTRGDVTVVAGRHDGYRRLSDPVVHQRTWCWLPGSGLVIVDELLAEQPHRVRSRLHLAPGICVSEGGRIGPMCLRALGRGQTFEVVGGRYSPSIGRDMPIEVVELDFECAPGVLFGWALLRPGAHASLEGRRLTVRRADGQIFALDLAAS